jgi:hypothetical protein
VSDLNLGIPPSVGRGYDVVLAADVIEHVRHPDRLLVAARQCIHERGSIIASVPNFGHWYPRLRVAAGAFDYDRRGILDEGHVRFFTRRSFERLAAVAGLEVRRREGTGTPIEVLGRHAGSAYRRPAIERAQNAAVALRPTLFAYQFVYELRPLTRPDERHVVTAERIEPISDGQGAGPDVTASSVPA